MSETIKPLATEKQLAFLKSLLEERVIENEVTRASITAAVARVDLDRVTASKYIEWLLTRPKVEKPKPSYIDPPFGMHKNPDGKIIKVYKTRNGYTVAKALTEYEGNWQFTYVGRSGLKGLSEATTLPAAEAAAFGKTYGICINCAAHLTDERSIFVGYGPICAGNNGWPYPTMTEALEGLGMEEASPGEVPVPAGILPPDHIAAVSKGGDVLWTEEAGEFVTEYEGHSLVVFPHVDDAAKWGAMIITSSGSHEDQREFTLPDSYGSPSWAMAAVIDFIDREIAEVVKAESAMEAHFAEVEKTADVPKELSSILFDI